jgi:histidine phosphotransferase ChpT
MSIENLSHLDLAALVCSRVCHDVISPVGAIVNGLEVLEDESDPSMKEFAQDLIRKSAKQASAKLQLARIAFGAAGSAGSMIDIGDAELVARAAFVDDKTQLVWDAQRVLLPKNAVKLLLNLFIIAQGVIPRGGEILFTLTMDGEKPKFEIVAKGTYAKIQQKIPPLVAGSLGEESIDAHSIQPIYTGLIAKAADMDVTFEVSDNTVKISAFPALIAANDDSEILKQIEAE